MRYYVRDTVEGVIFGPYSVEEARSMSDRMANNSLVFNEDIFEISSCPKVLVTGTVSGGVVDFDSIPDGVEVRIRDYDVDGCESGQITEDEDGHKCVEIQFGSEVGD